MTDKELAQLLRDNPDIAIVPERGQAPTPQQAEERKRAIAKLAPSEADMQAAVVAWAEAHVSEYPKLRWLFHVPNGEYRPKATAGRLTKMGINRGVPDLLLPVRQMHGDGWNTGLAIEMKRKPNRPTPEQLAWIDMLDGEGWQTHVCYSAEEAIKVLEEYLS